MSSGRYAAREALDAERACRQVQESFEGNRFCADCGTPSPEYLNLTIGTFVCEACADIHRTSSNRRIKDMYGRDLTGDDVRRMRDVGNEKANNRFLARWDPRDFPEPKPDDKEYLREFIWLKYEGSWKRAAAPPTPVPHRSEYSARPVSSGRPYYGGGGPPEYGREREIFRDQPSRVQEPARPSYWAQRYAQSSAPPPAPIGRSSREEEYSQYPLHMSHPSENDYRKRPPTRPGRFEEPSVDEEYGSLDSGLGSSSYRRGSRREEDSHSREKPNKSLKKGKKAKGFVEREASTSEESASEEDDRRKKKSSKRRGSSPGKRKSKSKSNSKSHKSRSKGTERFVESESESEDSTSSEEHVASTRQSKKGSGGQQIKKRRSKHRQSSEKSSEESTTDADDEDSRRKTRGSGKQSRRGVPSSTRKQSGGENPFASDEDDVESAATYPAGSSIVTGGDKGRAAGGSEFDLMSDWMGTETDAGTTVSGSASIPPPVPSAASAVPPAGMQPQPQQHQQHMAQPVVPPMSVYPGMMLPSFAGGMPGLFPPGGMMFPGGAPGVPMMGVGAMNTGQMMPGSMPNGVPGGMNGLVPGMAGMNIGQPQPPPPPPADIQTRHNGQSQPPPPPGPPPPE